jgi:C_GCAxxG_C_C family probable redox protein
MEQNEMMNGMPRREQAVMYKRTNNCCQAVLLAYAPELGLPEERLLAMGACFGSGMGSMEETCGALCGAQMVLGLTRFEGRPLRRQARTLTEAFEAKAGAIRCRDLKGIDTGAVLTNCDDCVRFAVDALEAALEAEG